MVDPFTDEEHYARAMLMGWSYVKPHGYYIAKNEEDPTCTTHASWRRYDAISMEPLDRSEVNRRTNTPYKAKWYD